jgi:two-component system LytT family response regulator
MGQRGAPLTIRVGDDIVVIRPEEIRYVAAANNYARVFTAKRRLSLRQSLNAVEALLPGRLVRVHRSILVNPDHVERLRSAGRWRKFVRLRGGPELAASAEGWQRLRARLGLAGKPHG